MATSLSLITIHWKEHSFSHLSTDYRGLHIHIRQKKKPIPNIIDRNGTLKTWEFQVHDQHNNLIEKGLESSKLAAKLAAQAIALHHE